MIQTTLLIGERIDLSDLSWLRVFLHLTIPNVQPWLPSPWPSMSYLPSIKLQAQVLLASPRVYSYNSLASACDSPSYCAAFVPWSQLIKWLHACPLSPSSIATSCLVKPSPTSSAKSSCFLLRVPRACSVLTPLFSTHQSKG